MQLLMRGRGPAHERLREHTSPLHQRLDARFDLVTLASREGYTRFLQANWPSASIELALESAGVWRVLPDWEQRRRRFALAADLRSLGVEPEPAHFPIVATDDGTLLGLSYVLEGSRLGAQAIRRAVATHGGEWGETASRFLSHGEGEPLWQGFRAALLRIDDNEPAIAAACAAASSAFEWFLQELS
jgi:heme oxygenase